MHRLVDYLVGLHDEALERVGTERGANCHVGGVAATGHQDAADAWRIVPRIERVPPIAEIDLEPSAEIHRIGIRQNANIAEIAGAVARGDVHAAAECDRQMRKISAHAAALESDLGSGPGGARVLIAEAHIGLNEIADRLHAWPAGRRLAE